MDALATEAGVSKGTVDKYEKEGAKWKADLMSKLARALGVSVETIIDESSPVPAWAKTPSEKKKRGVASKDGKEHEQPIKALAPHLMSRHEANMGDASLVKVNTWRGIVAGLDDECYFLDENVSPKTQIPGFFLNQRNPDEFIVCEPAGLSMAPRITQGDRVIVRLGTNPPPRAIIIARRPDGVNFIKVFKPSSNHRPELHSLNDSFPPITEVDGWMLKGEVVGIWKPYLKSGTNIEYDGGNPLLE